MVLRETSMPAILTENGFINTTADANKLKDPSFRKALAVAHAKGICDYFGVKYKELVAVTPATKEEDVSMQVAVAYWTLKDFSVAEQIAAKLGNCGMFCRNSNPVLYPDAKAAKHLIVIGGSEVTDHPNVTNKCGFDGPATAILAAQYAQTL